MRLDIRNEWAFQQRNDWKVARDSLIWDTYVITNMVFIS